MKASTSYMQAMEKHFPNHWPIEAFEFWANYYWLNASAPTYEMWEAHKAEQEKKLAPCVNEMGVTPAKRNSMQAACDNLSEAMLQVSLIKKHSSSHTIKEIAGEALDRLDEVEKLLWSMEAGE